MPFASGRSRALRRADAAAASLLAPLGALRPAGTAAGVRSRRADSAAQCGAAIRGPGRDEEADMVPEINYWAVLLATASSMAVGAIWYARGVFGTRWAKL